MQSNKVVVITTYTLAIYSYINYQLCSSHPQSYMNYQQLPVML